MDCLFDAFNHLGGFITFLLCGPPFIFFVSSCTIENAYIIKKDDIVKLLQSTAQGYEALWFWLFFQRTNFRVCCRSKGDQLPRPVDVKFQSSCENIAIMVLTGGGLLIRWGRWRNLGDSGACSCFVRESHHGGVYIFIILEN